MSAGQAPTPSDLAAAAAAGAARDPAPGTAPDSLPDADGRPGVERQRSRVGRVVAGLSEEEVEVMRLRDESATMMETLVRAKVEAAEVQGDYLKTRRALIRAVEKQAAMAERLDALKTAIFEGASSHAGCPAWCPALPVVASAACLSSILSFLHLPAASWKGRFPFYLADASQDGCRKVDGRRNMET